MTNESDTYAQAEPGKAPGSTFERKEMSFKTLRKRIALVAVAALAVTGLSTVPANAAVAGAAITDAADYVSIGEAATSAITFTTTVNNETATLSLSVPAGSARTLTNVDGTGTDAYTAGDGDATFNATTGVITDADTTDDPTGTVDLTPDVAGTYVFTLTAGSTSDTYTIYAADLFVEKADGISNGDESNLTANGVAGSFNTVTLGMRVQAAGDPRLIRVSGAGATIKSCGTAADCTIAADFLSAVVVDAAGGANDGTVVIGTPTAGTVTVSVFDESQAGIYSTTAYGTVTITVNAAASNGAISTTSTATMTASGTGVLSADALSLTGASTSGSTVGSIAVGLTAAVGSVLSTNVTTVSITGPGYLTISNANQNSTGRSLTEVGNDASWNIAIIGDGSTGKSTITITSGAWTATRTVTFYGSTAKIVATQILNTASSAGAQLGNTSAAATSAVSLKLTDSANNPVANVSPSVTPADTTIIASGACTASDADGVSLCSVTSAAGLSGKSTTVTFKTTVNSVDIVSNALTFKTGGALAKYTISFDKAKYAPGEKMTLGLVGVDATGNPTFDGSKDVFDGTATTGIVTSSAVTNDWTSAVAGVTFVGGRGKLEMFAPLIGGPFSVTVDVASGFETAVGATTLTATAEITSTTATVEAQITALVAAIAKLQKAINKINKRLARR